MEIIIDRIVADKLKSLGSILFKKNYFGFVESSEEYVNKISDFIFNIPILPLQKTKNSKYGKYYARYLVKNNGRNTISRLI